MLFKKSLSHLFISCFTWLLLFAACRQPDQAEVPDGTAVESQTPTENPVEEPMEEPADNTVYASYANNASGLALDYPENWVANDSFSGVTFASNQAIIDGESLADIGENGFVTIIPGELDLFNFQSQQELKAGDAGQALIIYRSLLEKEGQNYQAVEPPILLEVEADSSAMTVFRTEVDGRTLIMLMATVINDGQIAFITAASGEETAVEMRPTFNHMLNSLQLTSPAANGTN